MDAVLDPGKGAQDFTARLVGIEGKPVRVANGVDKDGKEEFLASALPDQEAVDEVIEQLNKGYVDGAWCGEEGAADGIRQAPYTTSRKLQQDASGRLLLSCAGRWGRGAAFV